MHGKVKKEALPSGNKNNLTFVVKLAFLDGNWYVFDFSELHNDYGSN